MNPEFRKVALAAAVLGLVVALFVALRPKDDDGSASATTTAAATTTGAATTEATPTQPTTTATTPEPTTIAIVVQGGRPVGGIQRVSVTKGEKAVLVVSSDVADEIHFHGYDLSADVEAGGSAEIPFTATIVGRFEVELEDRGVQLAEIEVQP
jgi:hypothetical protein